MLDVSGAESSERSHSGHRCVFCGGRFAPKRPRGRFCSDRCRAAGTRQAHARRLADLERQVQRLPWDAPPEAAELNQTARVIAYFRARPNRDISGYELSSLGYGGWRTEISRARRAPWHVPISPAFYKPITLANGKRARMSYYRLEVL